MLEIALFCSIAVLAAIIGGIQFILVMVRHFLTEPHSSIDLRPAAAAPDRCPSCGTSLNADILISKFCGDCGAKCA